MTNTNIENGGYEQGSATKDICLYKQDGLWIAKIKIGGSWETHSNKWKLKEDAAAGARAIRDRRQGELLLATPANLSFPQIGDPEELDMIMQAALKPVPEGKTFKARYVSVLYAYIKRRKLRNERPLLQAYDYMLAGLGDSVLHRVEDMKRGMFERLREYLLKCDLADTTRRMYAKHMRKTLGSLVAEGLPQACIDELDRLPATGQLGDIGAAFNTGQIAVMMSKINNESETSQILHWMGASGGPQSADSAFCPIKALDSITGILEWRRIKTGEIIKFAALPPLLALLEKRKADLGPDAIYFMPELIFKKNIWKTAGCNREFWDRPPKKVVHLASARVGALVNEFLTKCGIKTDVLTNKSWRKHNISLWSSMGVKDKARLIMAGQTDNDTSLMYDAVTDSQLTGIRDTMWEYYQAVKDGKPFFIPSSMYEVYQHLVKALSSEQKAAIGQIMERMQTHSANSTELVLKSITALHQELRETRAELQAMRQEMAASATTVA